MATSLEPIANGTESQYKLADLAVVNYDRLLRKDAAEAARLLSACADWGFFYLDLGHDKPENYLETVKELFAVGEEYFSRPFDVKLRDTRDEMSVFNICGFKPMGDRGLDAGNMANKKNGSEGMRVPIDLLLNPGANPKISFPDGLTGHWDLFAQFISASHVLANKLLESLSDSLGLKEEERLENRHRSNKPSASIAALQHYPLTELPPNTAVGHFTHTDTGSITVLFNSDWGLQVYSPVTSKWEYVAPRPNCAIVNVGDSLRFLSKFKLKSSLHRVVPCHGRWVSGPRYATIFFLRPNNDAAFVDTEGVEWTAGAWLNRKFENYRIPHDEQKKNAISTGKKGFVGLWDEEPAATLVS